MSLTITDQKGVKKALLQNDLRNLFLQSFQPLPNTAMNSANMDSFYSGYFHRREIQKKAGKNSLSLFARQINHGSVDLGIQLFFLEHFFWGWQTLQYRIFNSIVTVKRILCLVSIHLPLICSFGLSVRWKDCIHLIAHIQIHICFIDIRVQFPEI